MSDQGRAHGNGIEHGRRQIPSDRHITWACQYRTCGKTSCGVCRDGRLGHGPYWYAYWHEGARLRSGYVGKDPPLGISVWEQRRAEALAEQARARSAASLPTRAARGAAREEASA